MVRDDQGDAEGLPSLSPDAVIVEGVTRRGKLCKVIDNTGSVPEAELTALLNDLIAQGHFGPSGVSPAGGDTISIGAPQSAHVQLGEDIYRIIVLGYEARLEAF